MYRLQSYALLHHNSIHLLSNLFGLAVIAWALRRSYSNLSLMAVMSCSAITSAFLGTALTSFDFLSGASGVVYGIFGFLTAAQHSNDARLHPLSRLNKNLFLYFALALEVVLSLIFSWYGGFPHIAGFATGYLFYRLFETETQSTTTLKIRRNVQWAVVAVTAVLLGSWVESSYRAHKDPYTFVERLISLDDPILTAVAAPAVPDNPLATAASVEHAKAQAMQHMVAMDYNAIAIARADFWLGNTGAALERMRRESLTQYDDDLTMKLWLAIEHSGLNSDRELLPDNMLPAGSGGALLVSEQGDYLARLPLLNQPVDLTEAIYRPPYRKWSLLERIDHLPRDAAGIWPLTPNQFRTQGSAASAAP